jgi:hypothetical protein
VVLGIWDIPLVLAGGVSYPLVVDELFRDRPRLDRDQVLALGHRELNAADELEPDLLARWTIREWRETLRPFHRQLERAVGGRIELRQGLVERFAQATCPAYRVRQYARRDGRTAFAQVTETLEQRIGVELVDLLRLSPRLSRCPDCGRISARSPARGCGGFLARGPFKIEDCLGRPMQAPARAPAEQRQKKAMQVKLWRWRRDFGGDDRRVKELEREYRERFPARRPGPKTVSGDDLLP